MKDQFGSKTWTLTLPKGWQAWHDEGFSSLVGPSKIGALQISARFKNSEVDESDLIEFASDHIGEGTNPKVIQAGRFIGIEIGFSEDRTSWRQWYLRHANQMLFVTYNCSIADQGREDDSIREILSSLNPVTNDVV